MCLRKLIIYFSIGFYLCILISTEIFSLLNILNKSSIRIFWLVVVIIIFFLVKKYKLLRKIYFQKLILSTETLLILFIFILTFINSIIYSPNTLDAMTYHMGKVINWIQNENLNFYPTNDLREIILAPLTEYVLLHLYLILGSDYLSNLVQWYSMFVSCIVVSLIAKEFNCNSKYQIFSSLFCATLPMGILQSTSTQTDYVTTMWMVLLIYFILRYVKKNNLKYIISFGATLGLGILTKVTFYFFALPFCIWFGWLLLNKSKNLIYPCLIILIVLFINSGHFYRNTHLYGNPIGITAEGPQWKNEIFNIRSLSSNTIKNLSLNLSLPSKRINELTTKKINDLHEYLSILADDKMTTMGGNGYFIPFSLYESSAPNTYHFLLILLLAFYFFFKKIEKKSYLKIYLFAIIFSFLLFSLLVKWMPQGNRILLVCFVIMSPFVAKILEILKSKRITLFFSITLFAYSIPYIFFNKSRPLVSTLVFENNRLTFYKPFHLSLSRLEQYYIADKFYHNRDLFSIHHEIINKIKLNNCKKIGFDNYKENNLIYPFWVIFKSKLGDDNFEFYNINVNNKSLTYSDHQKLNNICAIVYINRVKFI
jgi:4-amino-4-deoxy-L-arabinose transferase-like glycosyltransferase